MAVVVRKATRKKAKLRLGISATAGSGKTMGALLVAYGLCPDWDKIGLIDTESGSGELYVNHQVPGTTFVIGEYLYVRIDPPYTVAKYIEAQKALEEAGCEVIIHDSTSHAWAGAGGLLDKQGKIASKTGNGYTAWRDVTPDHNLFVETMLQSPAHIIATMRSKTDYVQEKDEKGKTVIRKVGLAPVQREGMDFEFSVMLDIDANHIATATKDRTSTLDGEFFKLSPDVGRKLGEWLSKGVDAPPVAAPATPPTVTQEPKRTIGDALAGLEAEIESALKLDHPRPAMDALLARPDIKQLEGYVQGEGKARSKEQFERLVDSAYKRISERELTTDEGYTAASASNETEETHAEQQAA